jgi:hypothetical protein
VTPIDWKPPRTETPPDGSPASHQSLVTPIDWKHHIVKILPTPSEHSRQSLVTPIDWKPSALRAEFSASSSAMSPIFDDAY